MKQQFTFTLAICLIANILFSQQIEWEKTYLADSFLIGNPTFDVQPSPDSGFILAGTVVYGNALNHRFLRIVKTDNEGNEEWSKLYFHDPNNLSDNSDGRTIRLSEDGNWLVAGALYYNHEPKALLMKIDPLGDTIWTKTYELNHTDEVLAMELTEDGGTILVGRSRAVTAEYGTLLIRTDAAGNMLWSKNYFGEINLPKIAWDVELTPDGGYFLTGEDKGGVFMAKTDSQGDTLWTKTRFFSMSDIGFSTDVLSGGGYVIAGSGSGFAGYFPTVFKVDEDGNEIWNPFLTVNFGTARSVIAKDDGGIVITGSGWEIFPIASASDGYVAEYDKDGNEVWNIPLPENVAGFHVEALENGEYLVAGNSGNEMYLAKIGMTNSVFKNDKKRVSVKLFPNPVTNKTIFELKGVENIQNGILKIYDPFGRMVRQESFKNSKFEFERKDLTSGIYFYKLEDIENIINSGKIIIR